MKPFIDNRKILYVDDEPELLAAFTSLLRKENVDVTTLQESKRIEELLDTEGPFAVVFSDQRMPEYDGVHVLETVRQKSPDTVRILITGYADHVDTIRAINIGGITSYLSKPWDDEKVKYQINDWITQYNLKQHNQYLISALDEENKKLNVVLEGTVAQTVRILGDIANHVSPQIEALSGRVKSIGIAFLKAFPNLNSQEKWEIMRALDLFNIGFALLPPGVQYLIEKHGLSVLDRSIVARNHHLLAAGLLKEIPRFENVSRIVELQVRDYNGFGEPVEDLTKGKDIPFGARLLHILIDLIKPHLKEFHGKDLLIQMASMPHKYDIEIIKNILGKNIKTSFTSEERFLSVSSLKPGMILIDEIRSIEGQLFSKSDLVLTETLINILLQWHRKDPIKEPVKVRCMV